MPPKSSASKPSSARSKPPKKLTKKELEEQAAELAAALQAAEAARLARQAAADAEVERLKREEEEMVVREMIDVPRQSEGETRGVLMRTFGDLFPKPPTPPPPPPQLVEPVIAPVTPTTSRPGSSSSKKRTSSTGKRTPLGTTPRSAKRTPEEKAQAIQERKAQLAADKLAKEQEKAAAALLKEQEKAAKAEAAAKDGSRSGRRKSGAAAPKVVRKLSVAEQAKLDEEAALEAQRKAEADAAAQAEYNRLHPKFSPELEAELELLRESVKEKKEYTAAAEKLILEYYSNQTNLSVAEVTRLVNDWRLISPVDLPDENRRLKQVPLVIPPLVSQLPPISNPNSQQLNLTRTLTRPLPPPQAPLIDLPAIVDDQLQKRDGINKRIDYRHPGREHPSTADANKKKSRKAELDMGQHGKSVNSSLSSTMIDEYISAKQRVVRMKALKALKEKEQKSLNSTMTSFDDTPTGHPKIGGLRVLGESPKSGTSGIASFKNQMKFNYSHDEEESKESNHTRTQIPVSSFPLTFSTSRTLGLLSPFSPLAPRNKLNDIQPDRSHDLTADYVQQGFDVYPKLCFRSILIHTQEEQLKRAQEQTANNGSDSSRLPTHTICADQVRTVVVENSGDVDMKVVWKQYDLRSIEHHKIVEVQIAPSTSTTTSTDSGSNEEEKAAPVVEKLVDIDVSRYVYPDQGDSTARALSSTMSPPSSDTDSSLASPPPVHSFPFFLDPSELVIPAHGAASFRVIYDPTRLNHPLLSSQTHSPGHDITFIEGLVYTPAPMEPLPVTEDGATRFPPSGQLDRVMNDIDTFESRQAAAELEPLSDEETTENDWQLISPPRSIVGPIVAGNPSSVLRRRWDKYFTPKPTITWLPTSPPQQPFRLVLSASTLIPRLTVDKSKQRLKFVCQIPRPESAPPSLTSSTIEEAGLASPKTPASRPMSSMSQKSARTVFSQKSTKTAVSQKSTKSNNIGVATTALTPPTQPTTTKSQRREQLTLTKMLPLSNSNSTILNFKVLVTPPERYSLVLPPKTLPKPPKKTAPGFSLAKPKLAATLPLAPHLGWKSATLDPSTTGAANESAATEATEPTFTLLPGDSLVLPIRFIAPSPTNTALWPLVPRHEIPGEVTIEFDNGSKQMVPLISELLRPVLRVSPTQHQFGRIHTVENTRGLFGVESDEISSGSGSEAHTLAFTKARASQRLSLFFINPSAVDAHWSIEHIPAQRSVSRAKLRGGELSESMHPIALRNLSNKEFNDDADCLDEPKAFIFEHLSGIVPGGTGGLNEHASVLPTGVVTELGLTSTVHKSLVGRNVTGELSDGHLLLGSTQPEVHHRVPVQVQVIFRPRQKRRYKSVFRVRCLHASDMGEELEIELRGEGSHEEDVPTAQ